MKRLTSMLLVVALLISAGSFTAFAAEKDSATEYVPLTEMSNALVLFKSAEITDTDALIARAERGVDEFARDTGLSIVADGYASDDSDAKTIKTSQRIGTVVQDGKVLDEYVITAITSYEIEVPYDNTVGGGGCFLTTTLYALFDGNSICLRRTEANISTNVLLSRLDMWNAVQVAWGEYYSNNKTFSSPVSGRFTLSSPRTEYINSYSGFLRASDTVYLVNGTQFSTYVYVTYP